MSACLGTLLRPSASYKSGEVIESDVAVEIAAGEAAGLKQCRRGAPAFLSPACGQILGTVTGVRRAFARGQQLGCSLKPGRALRSNLAV